MRRSISCFVSRSGGTEFLSADSLIVENLEAALEQSREIEADLNPSQLQRQHRLLQAAAELAKITNVGGERL